MDNQENNEDLNKYIDIDAALSRLLGNKAAYKRVLELFLQSNLFAELETVISQKNYSKASEIAHGIKGMTGSLGMTILFDESATLTVQMRAGPPDEQTLKNYRETLIKTREYAEKIVEQLTP